MKSWEMIRRAARRPPGYLVRRAFREAGKRLRARRVERRARALQPEQVSSELGGSPLPLYWKQTLPSLIYSAQDRDSLRRMYETLYSEERESLKARCRRILEHEFDLLGSGPTRLGPEIDWHLDFKSGRRWELVPVRMLDYAELDLPSDVKVPWEVSRCHHLVSLGQWWLISRDEAAVREFERQIRSWVAANPAGLGVNWACTMEVALRALNWTWAAALFADAPLSDDFQSLILCELYRHGLWIPENLEVSHVNGNHYIADLLGMLACGLLFRKSAHGRDWLVEASRLLEREIQLQVESDGVDIEASIPYHRLALEIFLTASRLLDVAGTPVSAAYLEKLEAMFDYVDAYLPPEGDAPVLGDADDGRVLEFGRASLRDHRYLLALGSVWYDRPEWKAHAGSFPEDALWLLGPEALRRFEALPAGRKEESRVFPASGYYVFRSPAQYLFVDAAEVGFRGLGGHGHNDCLSFEWRACGRPLLTDSGLFVYTASPAWRDRFRSTEFHNTIRLDGVEINHFLSPPTLWFLGNDAIPTETRFRREGEKELLETGHTGYHRLSDPVTVYRTFEFNRSVPGFLIKDRLVGTKTHKVEFFFHAAPGAEVRLLGGDRVEMRWPDGVLLRIIRIGAEMSWELREGWFAPSYGVRQERPVLAATARTQLPLEVTWDLRAAASQDRD